MIHSALSTANLLMPTSNGAAGGSNLWLLFALMTVASWGLYGIFLHMGQMGMKDPVNGRYKAFLMVGVAYVLVAVLAPAAMMIINGSDWKMPFDGWTRSLIAGSVGAIGHNRAILLHRELVRVNVDDAAALPALDAAPAGAQPSRGPWHVVLPTARRA